MKPPSGTSSNHLQNGVCLQHSPLLRLEFYSMDILCSRAVPKFLAELRDSSKLGVRGELGDHLTDGCGLNEDWQAQVRLANGPGTVPVPALHPATSASLTALQWLSLSLKSCLETKLQGILPRGLVEWVSLANKGRSECPGWWVSSLVLFRSVNRCRVWGGGRVSLWLFLPSFYQPLKYFWFQSRFFFFLCHFQAACLWDDILYLFRSETRARWLKSHENRGVNL